jgi:hypothetical protein
VISFVVPTEAVILIWVFDGDIKRMRIRMSAITLIPHLNGKSVS